MMMMFMLTIIAIMICSVPEREKGIKCMFSPLDVTK